MLQKTIKMIIKASKVSVKNIIKNLSTMKRFMKKFKIKFLRVATVEEKGV